MNLDIPFQALKIFLAVAETGSFTRAATRLNQPRYRVSRGVQQLEQVMGVQLLHRTTRKTRLTEAGLYLFKQGQPLFTQLQYTLQEVSALNQEIAGPLKISAPEEFAQQILTTVLPQFQQQYPQVHCEVCFSNNYVDFYKEDIDFGLRIGELSDSGLKQRQLGSVRVILVATATYLAERGTPKTGEDLRDHHLLCFQNDNPDSPGPLFQGEHQLPESAIYMRSNRFTYLYRLVLQDLGIATLPDFYIQAAIASGEVQQVLPHWSSPRRPVQMVYPALNPGSLKHDVFQQFMVRACRPLLCD